MILATVFYSSPPFQHFEGFTTLYHSLFHFQQSLPYLWHCSMQAREMQYLSFHLFPTYHPGTETVLSGKAVMHLQSFQFNVLYSMLTQQDCGGGGNVAAGDSAATWSWIRSGSAPKGRAHGSEAICSSADRQNSDGEH